MQARQLTDDKMLVTEGDVKVVMDIGPIDKRAIERRAAILAANALPTIRRREPPAGRAAEIAQEVAKANQQGGKKP